MNPITDPQQQNGWHLSRGGQTYGPYSWEQLLEHARDGRISRRDKILDPRSGQWAKPTKVPGLFGSGGAAASPVGLSAAIKLAVGIVIGLAVALGALTSAYMWSEDLTLDYVGELFEGWVDYAQNDATTVKSAEASVPPEGLAYKGRFVWKSAEGVGLQDISHDDLGYFWIYSTEDGTVASLDFGEHLIDGYTVFLVSQAGSRYVFESSDRSMIERVRIVADVTDSGVTAKVTKINKVSAFIGGDFSGQAIPYEQYKSEMGD